jgi:hypothetical protein
VRENERLEEINARLFALEGRMATFEEVNNERTANRDKLLQTIIENQQAAEKRIRATELRIASLLAIVMCAKLLFEVMHK